MIAHSELELKIRSEIPALKNYAFSIAELSDHKIEVLAHLQDHLNHRTPVNADFVARSSLSEIQVQDFLRTLKTVGKADLHFQAIVLIGNRECARFDSRFVAFYPERHL